jgi:hypothetical protein
MYDPVTIKVFSYTPTLLMPEPRPYIYHNPSWLYSTFKSRATAEVLLSPELESGNLTTRDYDNAIKFLPGAHRRYPVRSLPNL